MWANTLKATAILQTVLTLLGSHIFVDFDLVIVIYITIHLFVIHYVHNVDF